MKLLKILLPTFLATLVAGTGYTAPVETQEDFLKQDLSSAFKAEESKMTTSAPSEDSTHESAFSDTTSSYSTTTAPDTSLATDETPETGANPYPATSLMSPKQAQVALDAEDNQALKEFIQDEVAKPLAVKPSMKVGGDARLRYKRLREVLGGVPQVGKDSGTPANPAGVANDQWVIEANIKFNSYAEKTSSYVHVRFKNAAGTPPQQANSGGSGASGNIELVRANFTYKLWDHAPSRLILVGGRMQMSDYFDSVVQYDSRLDGALVKYTTSFPNIGDYYIEGAAFVIDSVVDQYGYMGETSLVNIANTGWYARYSAINWRKRGSSRPFGSPAAPPKGININPVDNPEWRFTISQFTFGYEHVLPYFEKDAELYGAFLVNSAAKPVICTNFTHQNLGWYIGYLVGTISQKGDWAFEIIYEWVEAQAVPDLDSGIGEGRGNTAGNNLYISGLKSFGTLPGRGAAALSRGNTNYKGWDVAFIYAITDQLTFNSEFWETHQIRKSIGGKAHYLAGDFRLIYSF